MGIKKKDLRTMIEQQQCETTAARMELVKLWSAHKAICEVIHEQNKRIDTLCSQCKLISRPLGRPRKEKK